MGLFSSIKDFGSSIGVLAKLCNKTWDLLDHDDRVSYFFKPNKKLQWIVNGKSIIISYDYYANSDSLIINYLGAGGASYHLKFLDEDTLILVDEENNEDMCFAYRNSTIPLQTSVDVYRLYFSKQVTYLLNNKHQLMNYTSISDVDKITRDLSTDDVIRCIDVFKKYVPDFDVEYIAYLMFYKKKYRPSSIGIFEERAYSSIMNQDYSYYKDKLLNPKDSKAMNLYIEATEDLG